MKCRAETIVADLAEVGNVIFQAAGGDSTDPAVERVDRVRADVARLIAAAQGILADVDAPGHTIRSVRWESVAALRAALAGGAR